MMLKREASGSKPATWWRRWGRAGSAAAAAAATAMTLAAGCLDRPVTPQDPATSNIYVAEIRQTAVDKIDLLFMIDNSRSMADKQKILADAVPVLVTRLVNPICLNNADNKPTNMNADKNGSCPAGSQPEFNPIKDIHIAVVSSSLGAHGGDECLARTEPTEDDKAWPIGKVRNLPGWNQTGFLAWDPDAVNPAKARNNPPGSTDPADFNTQFTNMVTATGEVGCGYEASLEAWYRFLIDPEPPSSVTRDEITKPDSPTTVANFNPLDTTLLDLRSKFLRPDSLVAVIMLTDENDCSIRDDGSSWLVGRTGDGFRAPRSATICDTDPNNRCCRSCLSPATAECPKDPVCEKPYLDAVDDHINLRCYDQKRRFGIDLLQPIERYVLGLTENVLRRDPRAIAATPGNTAEVIQNPLFAGGQRDRSLVFLAGIVGVPWQDVSTEASWEAGAPLTYLRYDELTAKGRLDWILPPAGQKFPLDPLMYETPIDRTKLAGQGLPQTHPGINAPLVPSCVAQGGNPPTWACGTGTNPINGRETPISDLGDLQYACIFDLPKEAQVANCTSGAQSCDCSSDEDQGANPLCDGAAQLKAKAYPGVRELQVLKGLGDKTNNAIIASICPKISDKARIKDPSYGYTPAVSAIIERLKEALRGKCLPRPLSACNCVLSDTETCEDPNEIPCAADETVGQVSCSVIEARQKSLDNPVCPPCNDEGRQEAPDGISKPVHNQLANLGHCGGKDQQSCDQAFCLCEIKQFTGDQLRACQETVTPPGDLYGYCYIDPALQPEGSAAKAAGEQIVASCPSTQRRLLRFAGDQVPAKGAVAVIACLGANVQ